ncbi:M15 family metallopeptidase [uncultured Eubacterium sp.]|uniref:M15 family metallopeptidase n=1 Tax=uncultured Eubacterium sp. TaxID=165185 RepID=UPI002592B5EA|nr:M15 family metallopeptidase [uncultured Eubacterium sp.]
MTKKHDVRIDRRKLHPWLNYKLGLLLKQCEKAGIYLIITQGFRSKAQQDELYAQGRTKKGNIVTNAKGSDYSSQHQWGIAFDIAINDKKLLYDEATIRKVAKIAKSKKVGLAWGGDWVSPVDTPHFYLAKWGDTPSQLKKKYGVFDNFKKTWTKKVYNTKAGLNIWNKTRTKVLAKKVPNGTKVNVMYVKGAYAKVEYKGTVGYMKAKYLK